MKKAGINSVVAVLVVLLASAVAHAQFEHPDLKSGKKQIRSLAILPVHAEITKVGMKGGEPMMEESRDVEKRLAPVVAAVLEKTGCVVLAGAFAPEAFEKNPDLRYAVDDAQKQFDDVMKLLVRKSKDVRKARFALGDSIGKLNVTGDPDALVFVRASGEVLTGGKKAFGWVVGGQKFDMAQVQIGVVDARTGDVLYFAKPLMLKNLAKDTEEARSGIEKSFKNFVKYNLQQKADTGAAPKNPS